ncbi:DoxX-like family protein [Salegentibacter salinarum]|uniref:DoxX-like family protein n=1 Tax=Salegentibacter salinarum TaxID=447422 RepID=A0A2N0TW52_9FLAO|nr:DoxX family protein [Salegentibacter salinarum]PKD18888.1 DoxX-like family protein [Salegentibacter salinarum]SKB88965.1 DoxX-like family protein [Salegentibacter salinarum]
MTATKQSKIIYWIATIWLALGMLSTGIVQLIKMEEEVASMNSLGYPAYLLYILGVWKILGTIVILIPKAPLIKEWAYAGFFFVMTGAAISHLMVGDEIITFFGPILLLVLTIISWYFRPLGRKLIQQ